MKASFVIILFASGLATSCSRPEVWTRERSVLPPIPMQGRIAYVDAGRDRAVIMDATSGPPRIRSAPLGREPVAAAATRDGKTLAILTAGQQASSEGERDESPALYALDVTRADLGVRRYELGSKFDSIALAADGSIAVAYFALTGRPADMVLSNPNELAVVDLTIPPSEQNPAFRTVRAFSQAPLGVVLSPPMVISGAPDGENRVFAFVLFPGAVTIVDARHPTRREATIRLGDANMSAKVAQVVFAPSVATAYLRAEGANDVFSVQLGYEPPSPDVPDDNDFQPVLAELGSGGTPGDLAVYDDSAGIRRLVVATPGLSQVSIIQTDTAEARTISADDPVDRILLVPETAPRIAVLASLGAHASRVHLLHLDGLGDATQRPQVDEITLARPIADVVSIPAQQRVLIVHDDARTVLGILDVQEGAVSPLEGMGPLDSYDFSGEGEYLLGVTRNVPQLGMVDLSDLHATAFPLDAAPSRVFGLPQGGVYIDHDDPSGCATWIPRPDARRDEARLICGFLLADLL